MKKLVAPWLVTCLLCFVLSAQAQQSTTTSTKTVDPVDAARSCSTTITSCGCVITQTDTYIVANDLNANQSGKPNCIEIAADHAILNLKGFAVIGNGDGTGIGILIRAGANHAVIQGGDENGNSTFASSRMYGQDLPGVQAVVTQWDVAIEDDGDGAVIELFKDLGGSIFQQNNGNATAGVLFKGVKHSLASNLHASYNGQAGIIVRNSSGINLSNLSADGNAETGIWLKNSDGSAIATASAAANGDYGMWLQESSRNMILNCNGTTGNGTVGILLGCANGQCSTQSSNNNRITNSGAPGNQGDGIVIQKTSDNNIVTVTHNDGNAGHDMIDRNPQCGNNLWYNNSGNANRQCIH